ncbi:uncharacterized protein si:ch211-67f13.7 [Oreochromis aureus]|uniref:Zona pellucida sperm-binding protein 3 n=1 Tax=Oreochromis aureus TaxID=47969 RepID=A0A668RXZ7_OREAU|nr:uncharacterized protein si:ch211-67f13.7 [Oreochromis aureus]
MKTKWYSIILWSVLSLGLLSSAVDTYESPLTRRKVVFKLPLAKYRESNRRLPAGTPPEPQRGYRGSYSASAPVTLGPIRPGKPELKIQSDFAYLPDVSVTCSTSDFVVRIKPAFYGLGAEAEELLLGSSCKSNGLLRPYGDLLFSYPLTACDGVREMPHGYLVYKFVLHYEPSPKRFPSRAHRVDVDIECRYPRNHHVHQLAVQPTWETVVFRKRLKSRRTDYQITLMDDSWSRPVTTRVYQLGQKVHIQVSAPHLPAGGKLYISSCYAAPSNGSKSSPKYSIIDNFGCMLDSKGDLGASEFVSRTDRTVRLSMLAFQFTADPNTEVSIHCRLFVTSEDPSPVYKSCTYRGNRWRALTGDDSICECCESRCVTPKPRRAIMKGSASSGSLLVSDQSYTVKDQFLPLSLPQDSIRKQRTTNRYSDEKHRRDKILGKAVKYNDGEEESGTAFGAMTGLDLDEFGFGERVLKGKWNESEVKHLDKLREEGSPYEKEDSDERSENEVNDVEQAIDLNQKESEMISHRVQLEHSPLPEIDVQPPDSRDEGGNGTHGGKEVEVEEKGLMMSHEVQWKNDSRLADAEDGEEMTWYFFWR